jgi:hypothetical protein
VTTQGYYRWDSSVLWFGVTLGSSIWLGITGLVLIARGRTNEGLLLVLQAVLAVSLWHYRSRLSAYAAWQLWFALLGLASLAAMAILQFREVYPQANLDERGMVLMWVGIGVGIPLLMLDTCAKHKSNGTRNVFSGLFDLIAGFF